MPSTKLPILSVVCLVVLMVATLVSCYCIAWHQGHIGSFVPPYISDLGVHSPEKFVFRQLLNMAVLTGILVISLRYVVTRVDQLGHCLNVLSRVACFFGIIALLGMSLVANFPECDDLVEHVHTAGAIVLFFAGTVYTIIDAILTLQLARQRDSEGFWTSVRWYGWFRPLLAIIAFGNMILGVVSKKFTNRGCVYSNNITSIVTTQVPVGLIVGHDQIPPNQSYIESAVAEWLLGTLFILYNMTFIPDFYNHSITLSAVRNVDTMSDTVRVMPDAVRVVLPCTERSRLLPSEHHAFG